MSSAHLFYTQQSTFSELDFGTEFGEFVEFHLTSDNHLDPTILKALSTNCGQKIQFGKPRLFDVMKNE